MQEVVSAVLTFVNGFLVCAPLRHVHGLDAGDAAALSTEPASAPLVLVLGIPPVHAVALRLGPQAFRHGSEGPAFPRLWVEEIEAPSLGRPWEALFGPFALALPAVPLLHARVAVLGGGARTRKDGRPCEVGPWTGRPLDGCAAARPPAARGRGSGRRRSPAARRRGPPGSPPGRGRAGW